MSVLIPLPSKCFHLIKNFIIPAFQSMCVTTKSGGAFAANVSSAYKKIEFVVCPRPFRELRYGRLIFTVFSAIAEFEREIIRERTRAGLDAARSRGRKGGRPRVLSD